MSHTIIQEWGQNKCIFRYAKNNSSYTLPERITLGCVLQEGYNDKRSDFKVNGHYRNRKILSVILTNYV